MDLTQPINVVAVNNTRVEYGNVLKSLNMFDVADILKDCTPMLGVKSSLVLGKTKHGTISKKYNGTFTGGTTVGTVVPRTLTVYPVVAEMLDEPEKYRRMFFADVAGGLWNQAHPFELWLLQHGIKVAAEELYSAIFTAKRSESAGATAVTDAFDGFFEIIDADITSGLISAANKNYYVNGAITRANAGEYLLDMWRSRHKTFRTKESIMWLPEDVADLYDDWYKDEHDAPPNVDVAGQSYLDGSNKRCRIKRFASAPEGSQRVILTFKENMIYGTDKLEDMKDMRAFESGNPYKFAAAMKYIFGTQFESVHEREFCVNDRSGAGSGSTSA